MSDSFLFEVTKWYSKFYFQVTQNQILMNWKRLGPEAVKDTGVHLQQGGNTNSVN
jgi:hypothetical protein